MMGGGNASGVLRGWEGGWVDDEHDDIRVMRYGHTNVGVGMWTRGWFCVFLVLRVDVLCRVLFGW